MKVQHVHPQFVQQLWPKVAPYLRDALEHAKDDYTLDAARMLLARGDWALLVAVDDNGDAVHGAAAVEILNRPLRRVALITAIGGHCISNKDTFAQLKELLSVHFGATAIEGMARESVARLWRRYGFEEKCRVVGVSL